MAQSEYTVSPSLQRKSVVGELVMFGMRPADALRIASAVESATSLSGRAGADIRASVLLMIAAGDKDDYDIAVETGAGRRLSRDCAGEISRGRMNNGAPSMRWRGLF